MISLEQVKLLESKVSRIIDHVRNANEENSALKKSLDSYQKRIEELEVIVRQFKEEQSRIEDGILSALDRLNKFEDAVENAISNESKLSAESTLSAGSKLTGEDLTAAAITTEIPVLEVAEEEEDSAELDIF